MFILKNREEQEREKYVHYNPCTPKTPFVNIVQLDFHLVDLFQCFSMHIFIT